MSSQYEIICFLFDDRIRNLVISQIQYFWFEDSLYRNICRYFKSLDTPYVDDLLTMKRKMTEFAAISEADLVRLEKIYNEYFEYKTTDIEATLDLLLKNIRSIAMMNLVADSIGSNGKITVDDKVISSIQNILDISFKKDTYYYNFTDEQTTKELLEVASKSKGIASCLEILNVNSDYNGYVFGDLVMFCGATKTGKTLMLMNEAVCASKQDYKVLYIAIGDMTPLKIYKRLIGTALNIDRETLVLRFEDLRKSPEVTTVLRNIDCLVLKPYEYTIQELLTEIKKRKKNSHYDVIIIDYDANLRTKNSDMFNEYAEIYGKLKGLAQEGSVVLTASQIKSEYQSMERFPKECPAESSAKNRFVDYQINIGRNPKFKKIGTAEIVANRDGPSDLVQRLFFNEVTIKSITEVDYYSLLEKSRLDRANSWNV